MDDAAAVGVGQCPRHLLQHPDDLGRRERSRAADALCQRLAVHETHDEAEDGAALLDGVHRHDVGVRERGRRAGFPKESLTELGTDGQLGWQDLDGHGAVERQVAGEIHGTHAATPELALDGIAPAQGALDFFGFGGGGHGRTV